MSTSNDLEALVAKSDIHDVLMRYCRGVDRRDIDLIISAFHPDAIIDHGRGDESLQELAATIVAGEQRGMMHFIGNEYVELDDDRAYSETYFVSISTVTHEGTDATRTRGGRYLDRFERRDDTWRIAHRRLVDEWSRVDELKTVAGGRLSKYVGIRSSADLVYVLRDGWRGSERAQASGDGGGTA